MARRLKQRKVSTLKEHPVAPDFFIGNAKDAVKVTTNIAHLVTVKRPALPIIVVPGIMASRLGDIETKKHVWNPDAALALLNEFSGKSPQDRYDKLANPEIVSLAPMNFDKDFDLTHCKDNFGKKYPHGEARGWGGVFWGNCGGILTALDDWKTPLKQLVDLPVYAFAYNWMEDNKISGKRLNTAIDQAREWHSASHVVLVTHSMGGVVARSACKQHGAEAKVYGVVHTAQPALGSADTYRRMIAGEMGGVLMADVIGPTGHCITAILGHCIAGLELLPLKEYGISPDGVAGNDTARHNQWLHLVTVHDDGTTEIKHYPNEDPYAEIYLKGLPDQSGREAAAQDKVYWRLMREEWLHPQTENPETGNLEPNEGTIERIVNNIYSAKKFNDDLNGGSIYCHPRTVQLYSAKKEGSDTKHRTFCEIVWETREKTALVKKLCREIDEDPDYADRLDFPIQQFLAQSNLKGKFQQLILLRKGEELTDSTPHYTGMVTNSLFHIGGEIRNTVQTGGRVFVRRLLARGENTRRLLKQGEGVVNYPRSDDGDGTVAEYSGRGLNPDLDIWKDAQFHMLPRKPVKKNATFRTNNASHMDFFDKNAILATKNALHNMILAWIEEHGAKPGERFGCALECLGEFTDLDK